MKDYERLERLLLEKPYEALTAAELSFVNSLMTAAAYTTQRELMQRSSLAFASAPPPPDRLSESLRAAVRSQKRTGFKLIHYVGLAAALMGAFLLGRWSNMPEKALPLIEKTATIIQTEKQIDTLYLERIQEKVIPQYIYREVIVHDTIYVQAFADKGFFPDSMYNTPIVKTITDEAEKSQNAKMTSRLLEMIVDVY